MARYERKDFYYRRAKNEGHASRAFYKLEELDRRFSLFVPGRRVLELGAAPGGWLQYAAERVGAEGLAIGVDRNPIEVALPPSGDSLVGDIFAPETEAKIAEKIGETLLDVMLSDCAPNISGIAIADQARSAEINERACALAARFLKPGGVLIVKGFQGEVERETEALLRRLAGLVRRTVPEASRKGSKEFYFIATGWKGPEGG